MSTLKRYKWVKKNLGIRTTAIDLALAVYRANLIKRKGYACPHCGNHALGRHIGNWGLAERTLFENTGVFSYIWNCNYCKEYYITHPLPW